MYSRYIPPPKGSKASGDAAAPALVEADAPARARAPADGFSYARYVPGASSAIKPETTAAIRPSDQEPSSPKPKRKREAADELRSPENKKPKTQCEEKGVGQRAVKDEREVSSKKKNNRRKRKRRTRASDDDSADSEGEMPRPEPGSPAVGASLVAEVGKKPDKGRRGKPTHGKSKVETPKGIPTQENSDMAIGANEPAEDVETCSEPVSGSVKGRNRNKGGKKAEAEQMEATRDAPKREQEGLRHKAVLERKAKSLKLASEAAQDPSSETEGEQAEGHGLEPLPQPVLVADDESKPMYDTLPSWLANPIRVSQDARARFTDLGIPPKPARFLEQRGLEGAFAVQAAAIPLLQPTSKDRPGDVLISAATGSGKTLAYALPIVGDVSRTVVTRLRALVVLPTRELVRQAQEVFEVCARAYDGEERKRVRIGLAVGSQSIKNEQQALIESESRYDPEVYQELEGQSRGREALKATSADVDALPGLGGHDRDARLGAWEGEVVDFSSKVDVLICTPGRLVEHIEQTAGFSLDYVRWLVVDEADKLLAQSFQGWLDLVMDKFQVKRFSARDFADMGLSGVRKIILSATLTRDVSLLSQLALRRPQLIVLDNEGTVQVAEHALPASLREFAVRVHETDLKPLFLLDLVRGQYMKSGLANGDKAARSEQVNGSDSDGSPASASDTGGSWDGDWSDAHASRAPGPEKRPELPHTLIFTKSNESALRLSRLLALLDESLSGHTSTLTSTTPTHFRRKTLRAFTTPASPVRLIIASDLVSRGIDIPKLGHVINYDLPPSVSGYVHRVGRTARAGRPGCAWTLVGDDESGWFWGKIAKGQGVRRAHKVERTRIEEMGEVRVREYEDALAKLGKEALEVRR